MENQSRVSQTDLIRRAQYVPSQQAISEPGPENDRLKMLAQGLGTLGAVYAGLQSFGGKYGSLFGEVGEAFADPLRAMMEFVQEGRRRYQKAPGTGYGAAQQALMDYATTGDLAGLDEDGNSTLERAKKNAAQARDAASRVEDTARLMTNQKMSRSIAGMARDLAETKMLDVTDSEGNVTGQRAVPTHPRLATADRMRRRVEKSVDDEIYTLVQRVLDQNEDLGMGPDNFFDRLDETTQPYGRPNPLEHGLPWDDLDRPVVAVGDSSSKSSTGGILYPDAPELNTKLKNRLRGRLRDFLNETGLEARNAVAHGLKYNRREQTRYSVVNYLKDRPELAINELTEMYARDPQLLFRALESTAGDSKSLRVRKELAQLIAGVSTHMDEVLSQASNIDTIAKDELGNVLKNAWERYTAQESIEANTELRLLKGVHQTSPANAVPEGSPDPSRFTTKDKRMSVDDLLEYLQRDSSYQRLVADEIKGLGTGGASGADLPDGFSDPSKGTAAELAKTLKELKKEGDPFFIRTVSGSEFDEVVEGSKPMGSQDEQRASEILAQQKASTGDAIGDVDNHPVTALYINETTGKITQTEVTADQDLFDFYDTGGRAGGGQSTKYPSQQLADETAQSIPGAADVTRNDKFKRFNFGSIATGVLGDDALDLFDSGKGSVLEQLQERAEKQVNHYLNEINEKRRAQGQKAFKFEISRTNVDDRHQSLVATLYEGSADPENKLDSVEFGIATDGTEGPATYRTSGKDRAFTNPLEQLDPNGIYAHDKGLVDIVSSQRKSNVVRAEERVLLGMANFAEKFARDVQGGREQFSMSFFERIVSDAFKGSKLASKTPMDVARSSLQVQTAVERRYDELKNSPTRRDQVRQGLESLDNLRRLYNSGGRFFTSDSEFISPETMGEAGIPSSAKTPFEVAGAVVDPNKEATLATIDYKMDLEAAKDQLAKATGDDGALSDVGKQNQQKLEEEIKRVYTDLADMTEQEADARLATMKSGGELVITDQEGKSYDLLNKHDNKQAQDAFPWLRERGKDESLSHYYMDIQNDMLDELQVSHSVGQNYHQAEDVVYQTLSRMSGVQAHQALQGDSVIDMMNIAHAIDPNAGISSKSLDNIGAAVFDLESTEYQDVMGLLDDIQQNQQGGKIDFNKAADAAEQAGRQFSDNQRKFIKFMHSALQEIPGDLGKRHTAFFDAIMTGRVALLAIGERLAKQNNPSLNMAEEQSRKLLGMLDQFAGDRNAAERFGMIPYGGFHSDGSYDDEPSPFLQGQDDATLGRAVMMHARTIPFARLQNPIRQLYQRVKAKQLLGPRRMYGDVIDVEAKDGNSVKMARRARLSGGGTLTMQERRRQRHANLMGQEGSMYAPDKEVTGSGDDLLETSREAPFMFSGFGIDTQRHRDFYDSPQMATNFGVTSRVAFLPNNHRRIWESQGVSTTARAEALKAMPAVRTQKAAVDLKKLRPESTQTGGYSSELYDSQHMQDWVKRTAGELDIDVDNPVNQAQRDRQLELLKEAYYLETIAKDDASGITPQGVDQINEAIEMRKRRAQGTGVHDKDLIPLRMQQAAEGSQRHLVGNAASLFNPNKRGDPLVMESLTATKHADLLGLDIEIEINEDSQSAAIKFHFIEDPKDTIKELTFGSKVGVFGSDTSPVLGMAGETGIMEAAFTKTKRRDFANALQTQIGRLYNSAVEDLQKAAQSDGFSLEKRAGIINKLVKQLSSISGVDEGHIRNKVLGQGGAAPLFADFVELTFTDTFSRGVERNFSTTKMMAAAKDAGLSMKDVFEQGSQMLRRARGIAKSDKAKNQAVEKEVRDLLVKQLDQEIDNVQNFNSPKNKTGFSGMFGPTGVTGEKEKQGLKKLVKKLKRQRELLNNLFEGNGTSLSDLSEEGSLWDLYVDDEGHMSASFRALAPSKSMQLSTIGGSMFGESFEKRVGRATKRKQSSMLTATLVSTSGSTTIGGATQEERAFAEVMQAWGASKSGMSAFRDKRMRRKISEEIVRNGLSGKLFDESLVKEEGGVLYYGENDKPTDNPRLDHYIADKFTWKDGALYVSTGSGRDTKLEVDAFATLRATERRKSGVVGMITGELPDTSVGGKQVGGDGRVLRLQMGGDQTAVQEDTITASEFHALFGKETRAAQHARFTQGVDPDTLTDDNKRAFPGYDVYHGAKYNNELGVEDGVADRGASYRRTILNSNYDYLEVDIFGGMGITEDDVADYTKALKEMGVSDKELSRLMLSNDAAKEALKQQLYDDDNLARAEVDRVVDYITDRSGGSGLPKIFLETRTGASRPQQEQLGGGVTKTNVRQWAQLADRMDPEGMDAFRTLREAVQEIHDLAQNLDLEKKEDKRKLLNKYNQVFRNAAQDGTMTEAQDFYAGTIRKAATGLVSQLKEAQGRYFGGQYKLSANPLDLQKSFLKMANARGGNFDEAVEQIVKDRYLNLADANPEKFETITSQAKEELKAYIDGQMNRHGQQAGSLTMDDIAKWQGMGVGEGFIGADGAKKALESMRNDLLAYQSGHFSDSSDASQRAMERLDSVIRESDSFSGVDSIEDLTKREIAILEKELETPGSTSGMIAMTVRQPDFTAAGGYEMSRLTVFKDATLRALGKNPSQMHLTSNPLIAWSRKGDFDYDLDFMTLMDSGMVAGMARETRAQTMPIHMVNLFRAMESADSRRLQRGDTGTQSLAEGPDGPVSENAVSRIDVREESFDVQVDGQTHTLTQTRVATPISDTADNVFGDSLSAFFAAPGMAINAAMQGRQARSAYALQQSIVGAFGAYAKQGAIKTRQRNSAFNSLMTRLTEMTGDGPDQFTERQMNEFFNAIPGNDATATNDGAFTKMLKTFNQVSNSRNMSSAKYGKANVGDLLHMAALTEMEITQAVAIEKYKTGDAQRVSRRVNEVMQALHGNYSNDIQSFDDAWKAFTTDKEIAQNLPFDVDQFFSGFGGERSSMEMAREAFQLQHDMNVAVRQAKKAGIGTNYMVDAAGVEPEDIDPGQRLALADDDALDATMASDGTAAAARSVGNVLKGMDPAAVREFMALQKEHNARLAAILESGENTLVDRMKNTLRELPVGAKGLGAAAAAATGLMAMSGGPQSQASSEQYDLPSTEPRSYALGNPHTARNQALMYDRRMQKLRYSQAAPVRTGRGFAADRPPTMRATY